MKLVIKIPEELYAAYKGRPPMLGDAGMDMIVQAIANGTPIKTVTNAKEAEAYPNHQEYLDEQKKDSHQEYWDHIGEVKEAEHDKR